MTSSIKFRWTAGVLLISAFVFAVIFGTTAAFAAPNQEYRSPVETVLGPWETFGVAVGAGLLSWALLHLLIGFMVGVLARAPKERRVRFVGGPMIAYVGSMGVLLITWVLLSALVQ